MVQPQERQLRGSQAGEQLTVLAVLADRFQLGWLESALGASRDRGPVVIEECRSPLEATQRAERISFDVCFLDDRFGERATLSFLHTIRAWGKPFPTVLLAGRDNESLVVKAFEAGIADYLLRGQVSHLMVRRSLRYAREQHKMEQRERGWQQRYRNLFERSQAPAYQLAADGTLLHCNQAMVHLLGYRAKEEVIGKPLLVVDPPGQTTPQPMVRFGQRAFLGREVCLQRADGGHVWVRMSDSLTNLHGEGLQVFEGTAVDVSQSRHLEVLLREREAQYLALFDVMAEGMLVIGPNGKVSACNRRAEILLGLEIQELLSRPFAACFESIHGPNMEPVADADLPPNKTLETGEPVSGVVLGFRRHDGRQGWASLRTTSVQVPGERGRGSVIVTLSDRTRLKNLESQVVRAQKMEVVGRLAGGMAHEFRNLLTAVAGYSELLLADEQVSEAAGTSVEEIRRAAKRASSLASQMLNFSRRDDLDLEALDVDGVLGNLRGMLERLLGGRVRLTMELDSEGNKVRADHGQLEQVILNLVLNSRDALTEGGRLRLRTEHVEIESDAADRDSVLASGGYVVLTVEDDGCGMDSHTLQHAFDPFFTTKAPDKGTGLGLPAVRDIVRGCCGDVRISSLPGEGTTVRIFLPSIAATKEPAVF